MSSPLLPDPAVVALLGDLHGNLGFALEQLDRAQEAAAQVVVQLGDFGYWRGDPLTRNYLLRLECRLAELDVHLLWLDGNHEDHDRLDAKKIDPATGPPRISEHVHHCSAGFAGPCPATPGCRSAVP